MQKKSQFAVRSLIWVNACLNEISNKNLYLTKSAPCALASHSATSPLFKHRQISIERPKLSIAAAVSRAFWSLPILALPASVFSGQLGILPLSQPSVAHLPPPAAPLAAALPPHPASGSRNTCQGRGHVAAPGDQLPNTPPGKKVELHRPERQQRSGSSTTASSERRRRGRTHRQ